MKQSKLESKQITTTQKKFITTLAETTANVKVQQKGSLQNKNSDKLFFHNQKENNTNKVT